MKQTVGRPVHTTGDFQGNGLKGLSRDNQFRDLGIANLGIRSVLCCTRELLDYERSAIGCELFSAPE